MHMHTCTCTHIKKGNGQKPEQREWGLPLKGQFCSSQHSLWSASEGSREALSQGIGPGIHRQNQGSSHSGHVLSCCTLCSSTDWRQETELSQGQGSPQNHRVFNGPRALGWKLGQEDELVWMMQG